MSKNLDFRSEAFRPYAIALGELALVWNDLHMALSYLFWTVTRIPNGLVPDAIWNSLTSDRSQREMLKSIIDLSVIGHNIPKLLRVEMLWLLAEINKLEDLRNSALHTPFLDQGDGSVSPWHARGHKRAKRFAGKDVLHELRWFYDAAVVLREHAMVLAEAHRKPDETPPKRPRLPNRGGLEEKQQG